MTKAPYENMQDFTSVLNCYNEYRFAVWKREHGLAAHYAYETSEYVMPNVNDVKRHVSGE